MLPIAQRASRFLARVTDRHMLRLRGDVGVVSFTFDDAPMSACIDGAHALEMHGARGTFYIAGGLTDDLEEGLQCHSEEALRKLLADGHQLGCHSYSHVRVNMIDRKQRRQEFEQNGAFLAGLGVDLRKLDFAYPFGGVDVGSKHDCAARFRSSRATGGGTHVGSADLNNLRTHRFYRARPDSIGYQECLAVAAGQRGWLVVNTHEVEDEAGPFGCSPAELQAAVGQALDAGCRVMSVADAIDYWTAAAA